MRLEPELWDALTHICEREREDLSSILKRVEQGQQDGGRTSAIRVFILLYFRAAATESGHTSAGHGKLSLGHHRDIKITEDYERVSS